MNIGKRIKELRENHGWSQEELAFKLGYKSRSTINKIECGINDITQSKVIEFAKVLDTSIAYLMGWEEEKLEQKPCINMHDEKTKELLCNYNKLNDKGKHEVRKRASELTEIKRYLKNQNEEIAQEFYIDFMDLPASAGTGIFLSEEYKCTIAVKDTCTAHRASFALRVCGDSMSPKYSDGDIVFVKSMPVIEVGEVGIFVVNGCGYIKELGENRLISLNPKYNDIPFEDGDSIVCIGKVIGKEE